MAFKNSEIFSLFGFQIFYVNQMNIIIIQCCWQESKMIIFFDNHADAHSKRYAKARKIVN